MSRIRGAVRFLKSERGRVSPYFLGTLIGFALAPLFLRGGGADGWSSLLASWRAGTVVPAWIYLVLSPLTLLPFWPCPLRWIVLIVLTLILIRFAVWAWGTKRWWIPVFSMPVFWNFWLAQDEFAHVFGAAAGWLVVQKKLHPAFWGLAGLMLITKVQVGWGLAVLFTFWIWREQGIKALLWAAGVAAGIVGITLIAYPGWFPAWRQVTNGLWDLYIAGKHAYSNPVFIPLGGIAWLAAVIPVKMERPRRARMVAAATLLGSPYFLPYHCLTLMTMVRSRIVYWVAWLPIIPLFCGETTRWAWFIPCAVLLVELWELYQIRRQSVNTTLSADGATT